MPSVTTLNQGSQDGFVRLINSDILGSSSLVDGEGLKLSQRALPRQAGQTGRPAEESGPHVSRDRGNMSSGQTWLMSRSCDKLTGPLHCRT